MPIIAISNEKGGVGKTTTAINLSYQCSLKYRTLVIDCDRQANLSGTFGLDKSDRNIRDAFMGNDFKIRNVRKNLDVLPSNPNIIGLEQELQNELGREYLLREAIEKIGADYDYIFIDCPPVMGLVTVNAFTAADYVLIPVECAKFSLEGIQLMIGNITDIKKKVNPDLSLLGLLITKYDERLKASKKMIKIIEDNNWKEAMFETRIRDNTSLGNSQFEGKTIFEYDRNSNGAKDYTALSKEILNRITTIRKLA